MSERASGSRTEGGALDAALAESSALHRVARVVARGAAAEGVFAIVAEEVAALFGVDAGIVWRFEDEEQVVVGSFGDHDTVVGTRFPRGGTGAVSRVWATGQPARARYEVIGRDDPAAAHVAAQGYVTGVAAPVRAAGRLWGAVLAATTGTQPLPRDAETRLTRFSDLVALAVANAEDRRIVARQVDEQTALRRVATAIASGAAPAAVLRLICEEAAQLTGCHLATVLRLREGDVREVVASWAVNGMPVPADGHLVHLALHGSATIPEGQTARLRPAAEQGDVFSQYHEGLAAPIVIGARTWGSLAVVSADGEIGLEAARALIDFAELARVAIADAKHRRRIDEYAAEQGALRRVATLAAADVEPEVILETVCREAGQLLGLPTAAVMRLGDGRHSEQVAVWRAGDASPEGVSTTWLDRGRDVVTAPIVLGERTWGVLVAAGDESHPVEPGMGTRLMNLAELIGIAVASDEARRRSVEDAASAIAAGGLDMEATLEAIVVSAKHALRADRATCIVLPDGEGTPRIHTSEDDPQLQDILESRISGDDARATVQAILDAPDRISVRERLEAPEEIRLAKQSGLKAYIAARLEHPSVGEGVLGILFIGYRAPRRFRARERAAVRNLMSIADLALANARLHERTLITLADAQERAATDPLTGLANHRAFHEGLRDEVERARRHRRPLSLALIDLDHFKDVNDRHGHQMGDEVLREMGARLLGLSRPEDLVARIGGEEFAWLLPESDALDAWKAAERARQEIAARPFADGIECTVSIGIAELSQASDAGELVRLADGALYWAKGSGRNVSFCYSPEVVEVLSAEERADSLERSQALNAIRALARAVDARDPSTRRHSERVANLAVRLAAELGWPAERQSLLREAGLVHDVGKIGVSDAILFKPARLSESEIEHVKEHSTLGAQIVADVLSAEQVSWVRSLHERMDGRGYPEGLAGSAIPDGARVLACADAWDVMTSARSYTAPLSHEEATAECRREAGHQFDPEVVTALERLAASGRLPADVP